MVEGPDGWNKELRDKLSFEFLIKCVQNERIKEWNKEYDKYLKSEWERLFPGVKYDPENIGELFDSNSRFQRPDYSDQDFKNALTWKGNFINANLKGARFRNAHLEGIRFWNTHFEGAIFLGSGLKGADFLDSHLGGSDFSYADIKGTLFWNTHLEKADFISAHLEGADFSGADLKGSRFRSASLFGANFGNTHLEKADFTSAHLEGAQFNVAVVNGETLFSNNTIDDKTDFTGTSLSSARIDPELRTKLERNIREISWEKWYTKNKMLEIPAKIFWKISDYGSSTLSILFTFLFSNFVFMMFYLALRDAGLLEGSILSSGNDLLLAYMQTTLVPFGILGIDLTTLSLLPVFIIFLQVIFGYTILAALVTRMAIMFQNLSP